MLLSPFCDLWYYYGDLYYYYYYMVSIIWQENKRETLIGLSSSKAQSLHVRRRKKQGVLGLNWTLLLCNYILLPYSSTRNQVCIYLSTLTNLVEVLENMAASPHALYTIYYTPPNLSSCVWWKVFQKMASKLST